MRPLTSAQPAVVTVGASRFGHGVIAVRDLVRGEDVAWLTGRLVGAREVEALDHLEAYLIQVGRWTYLDPEGPGRFLNHSCEPNAGIRSDRILVALTDISAGEEICIDYSTTMSERRWTMHCSCGATHCRGQIGDFHDLPHTLQERYLRLGVVQSFIVEEFWTMPIDPARGFGAPVREAGNGR